MSDDGEPPLDDWASALVREELGINRVLGLFDAPSFARRGLRTETAIQTLFQNADRERQRRLSRVVQAIEEWGALASGAQCWTASGGSEALLLLARVTGAKLDWGTRPSTPARLRNAARDLCRVVRDFNQTWEAVLQSLGLESVTLLIDGYNRFYVLEKECVLGSQRLAARHFRPLAPINLADLLERFPLLPEIGE